MTIDAPSDPSNETPMESEEFDRGDPNRRCTAHSSRTGERCRKWAILGGSTCATHGSSTAASKNAARRRLEAAADSLAKQLLGIASSAESESVRLSAVKDALDRSGVIAPKTVDVSVGIRPFESVFESAVIESGSRSDYRSANGIPDPESLSIPLPENDYSVGAVIVDGEVVSQYVQNATATADPAPAGQSMPEVIREPLGGPLALPLGESGYLPADEAVSIAADVNRRHRGTLGRF